MPDIKTGQTAPLQHVYDCLRRLYVVDAQIAQYDKLLKEIPKQMATKQQTMDALRENLRQTEQGLKQKKIDQKLKETELKQIENKIASLQSKRWQLKTNKELEALQHEIEFQEKNKDDVQTTIIEYMMSEDDDQEKLQELRQRNRQEGGILAKELAELQRRHDDVSAKRQRVVTEREALSRNLPEGLRKKYFLLLKRKEHIAISVIHGEACSLCGLRIIPQNIMEVRSMIEIRFCTGCNRILIYPAEKTDGEER